MKGLDAYIQWMNTNHFQLSDALEIAYIPHSHSYGVLAKRPLPKDFVLFHIPRSCLLRPENVPAIQSLLEKEASLLQSCSNPWLGLLLVLLHEKSQPDAVSFWAPYLQAVPNFEGLENPLFWPEEDLQLLLQGTGIAEEIRRDKAKIADDFHTFILPIVQKYPHLFPNPQLHCLAEFEQLVAFVMAYSFTEPSATDEASSADNSTSEEEDDKEDPSKLQRLLRTVMVPMADMLNHHTQHNAQLFFHDNPNTLVMKTVQPVAGGEELYNTYGPDMSNAHLLRMHGFCLPPDDNAQDIVELPLSKAFGGEELESVANKKRWIQLTTAGTGKKRPVIALTQQDPPDYQLALDRHGFLNSDETARNLSLLLMKEVDFLHWWERHAAVERSDSESSEDEEDDVELLEKCSFYLASVQKVAKLPEEWKKAVRAMCQWKLTQDYRTNLAEDEAALVSHSATPTLSTRAKFALFVRVGQKRVLHNLLRMMDN